jgi:phosphohistidine swiveling domain-containing protein
LAPGAHLDGPLIVEEATSTTLLHPGDSVTVDAESNLVITVGTFDGISRAASRWARSTTR